MLARLLLFLLVGLSLCGRALAADHMRFELIPAYDRVARNGDLWVGLREIPDKGWHTYWINPGDTGFPAEVDWTVPKGVTTGPIQWPSPERLLYSGATTYGYAQPAILMVRLHNRSALKRGAVLPVAAHVRSAVCASVCEQVDVDLRLTLRVGGRPQHGAGRLQRALDVLPRPLRLDAGLARQAGALVFTFPVSGAGPVAASHFHVPEGAYLFIEQSSPLAPSETQSVVRTPAGFSIRAKDTGMPWPTGDVQAVLRFPDGAAYRLSLAQSDVARSARPGLSGPHDHQ